MVRLELASEWNLKRLPASLNSEDEELFSCHDRSNMSVVGRDNLDAAFIDLPNTPSSLD